jgi:pimeloyl-ACP methyl ester carboxylesterase
VTAVSLIFLRILGLVVLVYLGLVLLLAVFQRSLIYLPGKASAAELAGFAQQRRMLPWTNAAGLRIGWKRPYTPGPATGTVLVMHGNAGTSVGREYLADPLQEALPLDVFVLEYPGYGDRPGAPSQTTLLAAAEEALALLGDRKPLYLIGESLGTGPTTFLAGKAGDRIAGVLLLVPYNRLAEVAAVHYPWLPVRWVLRDPYPADEWLAKYPGPVAVVLAEADEIIPARLGQALFDGYSGTKRVWIMPQAGHEDAIHQPAEWWSELGEFWGVPRRSASPSRP